MAEEHDMQPQPGEGTHAERLSRPSWDFLLVLLTVGALGALGAQSLFGTLYAWWAYRTMPTWEQTGGYAAFVDVMNAVAAPLVVLLVVVMGLCVPKRLFRRRTLLVASALMIAAGLGAGLLARSLAVGLGVYLAAAALVQVAVVVLTLAGARGLGYLSQGRIVKAGSGLLHLGFIVFAIVVVALQNHSAMLPVFALASVLLVGGSVMAFYARPTARELAEDDL